MSDWQYDLLETIESVRSEQQVFDAISSSAEELGFSYCLYGVQISSPLTNPKTVHLHNYPQAWAEKYAVCRYVTIDPVVAHCRHSQKPILWHDSLFDSARSFWEEARSHGVCHGWAQSVIDGNGNGGIFVLARPHTAITEVELRHREMKMRWLAQVSHLGLSHNLRSSLFPKSVASLTQKEVEILRWSADGKTAEEISMLLRVSKSTVDFHIRNAIEKMQTVNKTAAVVRATMLGLLS